MISEQAKSSIDLIFGKAVRNHLAIEPWDSVEVLRLPDEEVAAPQERPVFVLTIVSFHFKLMIIFHVNTDAATRNYFTKPESQLGFDDIFYELGNMCCGAINRELGTYFEHMGMSTPYKLGGQCIPHINVLRPAYIARHRITIKNNVTLHATLSMNAYKNVDFQAELHSEPEETGSIELF